MAVPPRLYSDLAYLWPVISPPEDYAGEAQDFRLAIRALAPTRGGDLLHLGCGGGHLDANLQADFKVTGVDLSPEMLALARALNPECAYFQGDLRQVRLGRLFDAVLIADSIDYMLTEADLRQAFETAYAHLKPGGVFCTYAESLRETFEQNSAECDAHTAGGLSVAYLMNAFDPDPLDTTYELTLVYLVRREGAGLQVETDRHTLGLFPLETWTRLLSETGFTVHLRRLESDDYPLFACLKPEGKV